MQVVPPTKMRALQGNGSFVARRGTLSLALAAGLAAALLAFLLARGRLAAAPSAAFVSVVVAARDIPVRTRLSASWLHVRHVSPASLPEGACAAASEAVGKVTTEPIRAGAAVTRQAVTSPSAALGMAFALPPSLRAVTVGLDTGDSADQFVRPGDHVDILATDEPGSGPAAARTVLQNVRLLAVGEQTSPDAPPSAPSGGSRPGHVTVAVSPVQAQALVLAAARGKIHLALRAVDDDAVTVLPASPGLSSVRDTPQPVPPRPRVRPARPVAVSESEDALPLPPMPVRQPVPARMTPPARVTVTVIKGSQSQSVSVEP